MEVGLATIHGTTSARNVILSDDEVRAVVNAAYPEFANPFGLLTETAAQTGARVSQLGRLIIGDLQDDRSDPRLLISRSAKGKSGQHKASEKRPVPISAALARKLRQAATGRDPDTPLLTKPNGTAWRSEPAEHRHPFARAVTRVGLDPRVVTIYACGTPPSRVLLAERRWNCGAQLRHLERHGHRACLCTIYQRPLRHDRAARTARHRSTPASQRRPGLTAMARWVARDWMPLEAAAIQIESYVGSWVLAGSELQRHLLAGELQGGAIGPERRIVRFKPAQWQKLEFVCSDAGITWFGGKPMKRIIVRRTTAGRTVRGWHFFVATKGLDKLYPSVREEVAAQPRRVSIKSPTRVPPGPKPKGDWKTKVKKYWLRERVVARGSRMRRKCLKSVGKK